MQRWFLKYIYLNKYLIFYCLIIFYSNAYSLDSEKRHSDPFSLKESEQMTKSILIPIYHADVEQVLKIIEKKQNSEGFLSKEGYAVMDKATHSLWITDLPERLDAVRRLIRQIDIPVRQISLQAYIVNADQNFTRTLGIEFSDTDNDRDIENNALQKKVPHLTLKKNKLNIVISKLGSGMSLEMALEALEKQGKGRILSSPRLLTSSGKTAYIGSGDEIPYQEKTSHGNTSVSFKKAVLSLEVTPQVLPDRKMILDLIVHQDKVSSFVVNGVPAIHTQEVRTQVRVNPGQTLVLGGIFEQVKTEQLSKVPLLGDLPIFGYLFRHKTNKQERRELLIFITPKIIHS